MQKFIEKYREEILGTLSGFDRVVFRAAPRRLQIQQWDPARHILVAKGMQEYLWQNQIPFVNFGSHVKEVSDRIKNHSLQRFQQMDLPIEYLRDSNVEKDRLAREIAAKRGIQEGPICAFTAMEPCPTFEYVKSKIVSRKRPCYVVYQYEKHPQLGFMYSRIQTWFPFHMQVGINGREWLARQMDREHLKYRQEGNCFPWVEDFPRAQQLLDEQLKTDWAQLLNGFGRQLNPFHEEIFQNYPTENYWTCYQSEWATDMVFRKPEFLKRLMRIMVQHAVMDFHCVDFLRFFRERVKWVVPECFNGQLESNLKEYREGQRVKFWMQGNSAKFYDKAYCAEGCVGRMAEEKLNQVGIFQAYRPKEGGDPEDLKWRKLRKGIADLHRRAEISQQVNNRLIDALAGVDDSRRLEELIGAIQKPTRWKQRRVRALHPFGEDRPLLEAVNHGELLVHGIRNRDLQAILYGEPASTPQERRRRSAAISRKLRMLRAHGIIHKVTGTHRYQVAPEARTMLLAILTSAQTSLRQINTLREKAA